MSRWTHIAGCIRVDAVCLEEEVNVEETKEQIEEILGNMVLWDDPREVWEKGTKLPMGSEGSIQYHIEVNTNTSSVTRAVISLWGDLRDFGEWKDIEEVESWFNSVCSQLWIRQAILQVDDEWEENSKTLIFTESGENK